MESVKKDTKISFVGILILTKWRRARDVDSDDA